MVTRGRQFDSGSEKPKEEKVVNLDTGATVFPGYVDWRPSRGDDDNTPVVTPPIVDDPNNPEIPKEELERAERASKNRTAGGTSTQQFIGNRITPRVDIGAKGKAKAEKSERRKQKRRDITQGLIDQAGRDLEAGNITQEEHDEQVGVYKDRLAKIKSPQTRTVAAQRVEQKRTKKTERAEEASAAGQVSQSKRGKSRIRQAAKLLGYQTHVTLHGTHIKDNEGNLVAFFPSKQGLAQKASGVDVPFDAIEDKDGQFIADAPTQSYIDQTSHAASLLEAAHYGSMQRLATARALNTAESTGDPKEQALGRKIIKTEGQQRADRELAAGLTKLGTQFLQDTHVIHHPTEGAILLDKDGNLLSHKANSDNFAIARADISPERASELEGLAKGVMAQDANIPLHLKHFDEYQTNKQTLKILAAEHANREILKAGHTVYPEHFPMRKKKVDGKVVMDSNGKPLLERAHKPVGTTIIVNGEKVKEMPDYALNSYLNHFVSLTNPTGSKQSSFNSNTKQLAYPRGAAIRDLLIAASAAKNIMLGGSRSKKAFTPSEQLKDESGAKLFKHCQNPSCESGKNAYEGKASETTIDKHCPQCTRPLEPAMKSADIATGKLDYRVDVMNDLVFGPKGWLPKQHAHVNDNTYTAQIKEAVPAAPSKNARKKTHEVAEQITAEVAPDSVELQRDGLVDQAGPQQIPKCTVAYCGKRHRDANGQPTTHEMDKLTPQQAQAILGRGAVEAPADTDNFEEVKEPKA